MRLASISKFVAGLRAKKHTQCITRLRGEVQDVGKQIIVGAHLHGMVNSADRMSFMKLELSSSSGRRGVGVNVV